MLKLYDITRPIHGGMEVYPGDPEVRIGRVIDVQAGGMANVSELSMGTHTGTHVDPPLHIFPGGSGADGLTLEAMLGTALVVEAPAAITRGFLERCSLGGAQRVLFKTGVASGSMDEGAAMYLSGLGVRLVGIDTASVDPPDMDTLPAHRALLAGGAVVLEGLDLSGVRPGVYELLCLPLRILGGDGAPARVVLREVP